jgi:hypothetical protein
MARGLVRDINDARAWHGAKTGNRIKWFHFFINRISYLREQSLPIRQFKWNVALAANLKPDRA